MHISLKDFIDIVVGASIILGVIFSYLQIRKISSSIDIAQKANMINVLNSFTKEYDSIMTEAIECNTQKKVYTWYFRLWNLMTNEFMFFSRGLLDAYIFEFWAFKICLYYNEKPSGIPFRRINTYKKSHLRYLKSRNGNYPKADAFFKELIKISDKEKRRDKIKERVHQLVKKYQK